MDRVDEAIKRYSKNGIGAESDLGPNTANDIESACEIWKKKVEKLKKTTRKSESKNTNEPEKYKRSTLNPAYEAWTKRVDEFERTIKIPYEPKNPERRKIADVEVSPNDEKTQEKDYERPTKPNSEKEEEKFIQAENRFEMDELKASISYQESANMGDDERINNLEQCDKKGPEICDETDEHKAPALEGLRKTHERWMKKASKFKRNFYEGIKALR
ncbi:hypothetical protein F8M41_015989 [Gigaspora margarita]|uniref:Uncharacterized protein n=1 Tax=Gigaspora margarita TaxID=4874 RepID=A0A8H4B380_GIGMA|nr:hypothetical protein F8M41_015989 [Gigaspora margarita]